MLEGKPPRPSTSSRRFGIVGILLAHAFALFLVLIVLVKVVPTYAIFFEQQGAALPVVTQRILVLSEFCVAYWFIMYFAGMVADAVVVLVLALAASRKTWLLSSYSNLCLLATSAVLFYVIAWLSHPVYSLVR